MSFIGLRVPLEVGRLLTGLSVPGDKEPINHYHITLFVTGKDLPIDDVGPIIVAIYEVVSKTKPFSVELDRISSFPKGEGKDVVPIICPVTSPELHELHASLKRSLDKAGVEYNKNFPVYKPHVTLSYAPKADKDVTFGPIDWTAYEVVFWGGDTGDEKLSVSFPLALPGKTALWRRLIQASIRR